MLSIGAFSFAVPWALAALALLPVLWWLLRLTPPAPWLIQFPPVRLLLLLAPSQDSSAKSPWWLLLLRLLLAVAVILAAAHPLLNAQTGLRGDGPLVLVIDDGWAAAGNWRGRQTAMANLIDQAERMDRSVVVVTTAVGRQRPPTLMTSAQARNLTEALQPKPWASDRAQALEPLIALDGLTGGAPGHVVWLSDGLDEGAAQDVVAKLRRIGAVTVITDSDDRLATVLHPPVVEAGALVVKAVRTAAAGAPRRILALTEDGQPLFRGEINFPSAQHHAEVRIELPSELRNRVARLEIENETTAAGVVLMDERWRRRPVGLVSPAGALGDQPLLGDLYYLERALEPFAEVRRGTPKDLLRRPLGVMFLADPGILQTDIRHDLERWIDGGGIAVRFAGPRLSQDAEGLLPIRLRSGDRFLGGTMSWAKPASLAPFKESSPFHGIAIGGDVKVRRQVLAQPSLDLADKTWAELSDGTPLVSAEKRGDGWLVLIHTTANTEWSDLPLSGVFVDMLRRLVALSRGVADQARATPLPPLLAMNGFGRLGPAPASALAIAGNVMEKTSPGPRHPPGYYGTKTQRRALNLSAGLPDPQRLGYLGGEVTRQTYGETREVDFRSWLLVAALLLAIADLTASLILRRLVRFAGVAAAMVLMVSAGGALAQTTDEFVMAASLETRLAYVITNNAEVDEISRAGLKGLSTIVNRRTAAELADPIGIITETDELSLFPFLYWPLTADLEVPSRAAVDNLNAFLRNGGTILFDTRDKNGGAGMGVLRILARALDIPPLAPIAPDHVLTRAYYLLGDFPGRWKGGKLWVERAGERVNDGVSSIIVGGNDWAAAWALDDTQQPLFAVVPGGDRQREMAYRFGINLIMYTLTGNYKSDQVHLPSIMRRLGL